MNKFLTPTRIALLYAAFASLWIFASDRLLALLSDDPGLILNISLIKGFAYVFITTWLLYQLMQTMVAGIQDSLQNQAPDSNTFKAYKLLAVFIGLALLVPVTAYSIASIYGTSIRQAAFNDLMVVAELKASQMEASLHHLIDESRELAANEHLINSTEKWLNSGDTKAQEAVKAMLIILLHTHQYESVLLGTDGHIAYAPNSSVDDTSHKVWREKLSYVLSSGEIAQSDLYLDEQELLHLDYLIPLRGNRPSPVAILVLRAPAESLLTHIIETWPTASPSAETVLARRDGDQIVFLNELRHRKNSTLKFHLPLNSPNLPIAISILQNKAQTIQGTDYRGIEVLAATHPIKGSNWHLVTKIDRQEVMALLNEMLTLIIIIAIVAITVVASAVLMLWRQQQYTHQVELRARSAEQDKKLKLFYDLPFIGMAFTSPKTKSWLHVNDHLCNMLGYSRQELLQTSWDKMTHADDISRNLALFAQLNAGEIDAYTLEKRFIRKDGSVINVNLDIRCTREADGKPGLIVAMIEDITERKKTEDTLRQSAAVFENSHDGISITDCDGNIIAVNNAFENITGYKESEVLGKNSSLLKSGRQGKDFYNALWSSLKKSGHWHGEIWNRHKDGEIYPEWLSISCVKNSNDEITHYVGIFSDLSQLKRSETELEHIAHYDSLTNLPNRVQVQAHLSTALTHARRHQHQLAILYIDLDRFKNINDSLGYQIGDELLIKLSERLLRTLPRHNYLGRLGGDEFLLVLEKVQDPNAATISAQNLFDTLSHPFELSNQQNIFINASIGISLYPNDGTDAEELIQHADAAMHQAKMQGRNTSLYYTEALTRSSGKYLEMETRLRKAIKLNQLLIYYQPQMDIGSGRIIGAEALLRWLDPTIGMISPGDFIPLAEETGLIEMIGEWVLRQTCIQGTHWIESGLPPFNLAVNISPYQIQRGNIVETVAQVLADTGYPAHRLELELTESALMKQENNAVKMLNLLRAQNIRLAIDDFGTGYSSLAYLKRFPLDILKIDQSFVTEIPLNQDDMEIASTIIAMGHSLGFKVLAEGVETEEQLKFLKSRGCDMYQGFLVSPAVPADEFVKLLEQSQQP